MKNMPISIKEQLERIEDHFKRYKCLHPDKNGKEMEIAFGISLKSKRSSLDWEKVQDNLAKTLKSILGNTDQNFRILVAGHETPEIEDLKHERVTWLPVGFPPPTDSSKFSKDKLKKRRVIGAYLRKLGYSGYFMPLDADDWIHYRFVEYIRSLPIRDVFILNTGFIVNIERKEAWIREHEFYKGCGSSALFYFSNSDFPLTFMKADSQSTLFGLALTDHKAIPNQEALRTNCVMIDMPFVVWVLAHGDNNSMIKGKKDPGISAKFYKAKGEKLEEWLYDYFKIRN